MQFNITTDYAIRAVLCLGAGNRKSAEEISKEMCISSRYLFKVLKKLKQAGVIKSASGAGGGYQLAVSLSDIKLGDIFRAMEPTMRINRCLEDDGYCSRNAVKTCPVRKMYTVFQEELESKMMGISMADILKKYR